MSPRSSADSGPTGSSRRAPFQQEGPMAVRPRYVAIIGSRAYADLGAVCAFVKRLTPRVA